MNEKILSKSEVFARYPAYDRAAVRGALRDALHGFREKIVVLDDDPTGTQTVHGVYVLTDWEPESVMDAFRAPESMFFILTNSRSMTREETASAHEKIARVVCAASEQTGIPFLLISRSDSTLRGHYPLETQTLARALEDAMGARIDGEIILPFFEEGGRYTVDDIHYVASGDAMVPAAMTEFARDKTFGYQSSNLREWVVEKHGEGSPQDVSSISLDRLRARDYGAICGVLFELIGMRAVFVNALSYADVEVFATALIRSIAEGKRFVIRSAAALTKVLGGIPDKPLLSRAELADAGNDKGGLIIAGSHVKRTTEQLAYLRASGAYEYVELDQRLALDEAALRAETERVTRMAEECIWTGKNVIVATRRERFDLGTGRAEDELKLAVRISTAITDVVAGLTVRPGFIIAKGGITSSEIGVKALRVKKALVLGQILPGVPVWRTGPESRFPNLKYVIFPGNVGGQDALLEAVKKLEQKG